jgi:hypothetical protein
MPAFSQASQAPPAQQDEARAAFACVANRQTCSLGFDPQFLGLVDLPQRGPVAFDKRRHDCVCIQPGRFRVEGRNDAVAQHGQGHRENVFRRDVAAFV